MRASHTVKRPAASCASAFGSTAPTAAAARANPAVTASRLLAVIQTSTSTARAFRSAWVNSTASWVLPVPP